MLDGNQQTGIWVNAQSIPNFYIVFGRTVFAYFDAKVIYVEHSKCKSVHSEEFYTHVGIRMIIECRVPAPETPDAFDVFESTFDYYGDYNYTYWLAYENL